MDIDLSVCYILLWMVTILTHCDHCSSLSSHTPRTPDVRCNTNSSMLLDECGVCGGDGSSCKGQGQGRGDGSSSQRSPFSWQQEWTPCSVSCGVGEQRLEFVCVNGETKEPVAMSRCHRHTKPYSRYVKSCVTSPCVSEWQNDDSSLFSQSGGGDVFNRHFGDLFKHEVPSLPRFHTGDWGPCSVTCGEGIKSRDVTCKRVNVFTGHEDILSDWNCIGRKPSTTEVCDAGPCRGDLPYPLNPLEVTVRTYIWSTAQFSDCSRSCLGGKQESQVRCVEEGGEETQVSSVLCAGQSKPNVVVRMCNDQPCPPQWDVGRYGTCSKQCGGGIMRRIVRCVQQEADDIFTPVEDFRCPDPVPAAETSCNNVYCTGEWTTGPWQPCSKTCGLGRQTRVVSCVTEPVSGHRVSVSDTACMGPRPDTTRPCAPLDCPEDDTAPPFIKTENYTFIQLRRSKKVRLTVGGKVRLLAGQAVTIRCPVKNYHRQLIFWSKRFKLIPMVGRVRASFNGNLKIRKANPVSDTGVYTCMAGPESADVNIEFLTRKEALYKLKTINHYLKKEPSRALAMPPPEVQGQKDGALQDGGRNARSKFVYMAEEWSPCSVSCGSGHQKRQVTCTHVARKFVKILPDRHCDKLGLVKPDVARKCSHLSECPQWRPGNWSMCSISNCVQTGYAERRRKLHCAYTNGSSAAGAMCDGKGRPETARRCVNIDCIPMWSTSRWTACRPSCGQQGTKIRMLTCSWKKTGLPAWAACRYLPRPNVKKVCKPRPCPTPRSDGCQDKSRYCSLARRLKMCRFDYFRRKCCKSCRDFLQSTLS